MNWLWLAANVTQLALIVTMAARGERGWTWRYLVYEIGRAAALAVTPRHSYWLVWLATELPSIALLLLAAMERVDLQVARVRSTGEIAIWIRRAAVVLVAFACCLLVIAGAHWPGVRRSIYLVRELGTFSALSILVVGWWLGSC